MNAAFKSDALLYVAFIAIGLVGVAENMKEKLFALGASVAILVIRSFVKKYLYK